MANEKPTELDIKHLKVDRLGNDSYAATELTLRTTDGGKRWQRVEERVLFANESRNVAEDFIRDWWRGYVGPNFTAGAL